jgi:hypothetical protein
LPFALDRALVVSSRPSLGGMSPFLAGRGGEVDVGEKDCNIVICAIVCDAVLTVPRYRSRRGSSIEPNLIELLLVFDKWSHL